MADIFISYAHEDKDKASLLASTFKLRGWEVWWDIKIPPGRTWEGVIEEVLKTVKVVVCLWSDASVKSREVKSEIKAAQQKVVPVMLEKVDLPYGWQHVHAANLVDWQGTADHAELLELMSAIAARIGKNEHRGTREQHLKKYREDQGKSIQKAPPEQVDIFSKDFVDVVERFLRTEEALSLDERKTRLRFYTEYVDRLDGLEIDKRLEEIKRLNFQYLSEYGIEVSQLKQMLRVANLYSGTGNDFPDDLVYAIKTYQIDNELKPVDGIFGPVTFQSLISKLQLGPCYDKEED